MPLVVTCRLFGIAHEIPPLTLRSRQAICLPSFDIQIACKEHPLVIIFQGAKNPRLSFLGRSIYLNYKLNCTILVTYSQVMERSVLSSYEAKGTNTIVRAIVTCRYTTEVFWTGDEFIFLQVFTDIFGCFPYFLFGFF